MTFVAHSYEMAIIVINYNMNLINCTIYMISMTMTSTHNLTSVRNSYLDCLSSYKP